MRHGLVLSVVLLALVGCSHAAPHATTGHPQPRRSATPSARTSAPAAERLRVARAGFRLPVALGREVAISDGTDVVVAGGLVSGDSSLGTAYRIDPRRGRSAPMPDLPVPVHDASGGVAGAHPLVIGGGNATEQSTVQGYDGNRWRVVGHLPQPRSDSVAATVAGRVLVLGGYAGTRPAEPDILSTFDGASWNVIGTLAVPVRYAASAVADHAVWLFGGQVGDAMQRAIQRIDPITGQTRVVGRLPVPTGHAVAMPLDGRILIVGGRTSPDVLTDRMWWFDPATAAVTRAGRLRDPLADAAVARSGRRYFLIGGETPSAVTSGVLSVSFR